MYWPTHESIAQWDWLQHKHKRKYMRVNEDFLQNSGRYYDENSTMTRTKELCPKVIS